jgi:ribonuclease BN (tRNA processing enzyme)
VKVTLVPSAIGNDAQNQYLSSYVVNEAVAIDAGSIGLFHSPREQERIRDIFLTHTHLDHVASLPMFLENVFDESKDCVTLHASAPVIDSLQRDFFNDRIWPDFIGMSASGQQFLRLSTLEANKPVVVAGLRVTPVPVSHVVPTMGFVIEDATSAVVIATDTRPTEEIWQRANLTPRLKAVFLDAAFPNELAWLADVSGHLTPALFAQEAKKLARSVLMIAVHLKARYYVQVARQLLALGIPNLEIGQYGRTYEL